MNIELTERGLGDMLAKLTRIETALQSPGTLKRSLGRMLVEQTRQRLLTEKTSPEGIAWAPWSPDYAATRSGDQSLLIDSHDLLDSIRATVNKDGASITSDVPYSARQNYSRPFLGVSDANATQIVDFVNGWMARI